MLKTILAFSLMTLFALTSCTTLIQTAEIVTVSDIPSETTTAVPTTTSMPTPTATATVEPIPAYMDAYKAGGYDKKNTDDFLCFVIDENKVHISPLGGIVFKERKIFIWVEVDYIINGSLKHGNVLVHVQRGGSEINKEFHKFTFSNSGASGPNGTEAFYQALAKGWTDKTEGDHTIACGILGLDKPPDEVLIDAKVHEAFIKQNLEETGVVLLFDGVFPVVNGKAQPVTIFKVGEVLPITQAFIIQKDQ